MYKYKSYKIIILYLYFIAQFQKNMITLYAKETDFIKFKCVSIYIHIYFLYKIYIILIIVY